jgi:4-amino-4-deoxy-L-arabinose transferase-like glycosyltransferase/predicted DNA-binding antitoxin AbrB/MazE fold protein
MSTLVCIVVLLNLAFLLNLWLISWMRRYLARQGIDGSQGDNAVYLLGRYSPVLTWTKHVLVPWLNSHKITWNTYLASLGIGVKGSGSESVIESDLHPPGTVQEDEDNETQAGTLSQFKWGRALVEWAVIALVVILFCYGFLDLGADTRLPGNESEVFQSLDWTLVNGLKNYAKFPLWNPYIRTGLPFIADPMLHAYNPVSTLPILFFGVQDGFKLAVFFSIMLAAFGMWWLGMVLGMGRPARLWMALMFAFAGQPIARFFQGQYLFVLGYAWIPWALAFLFLAFRTRKRSHIILAAISLALLFFSGNAYYSFYMLIAIGLFSVVMLVGLRAKKPYLSLDFRKLWILILVGVIALGVISIQLLPLVEFEPRLEKAKDIVGSHTPYQIFLDYTSRDTQRPDAYSTLPAREEFYAYIGLSPFLAFALLPLAIWKRDRKVLLFLGLLLLFVILWVDLDQMPWRDYLIGTDLLRQFRHLLRVLIYGSLAIIILAGLGIDTLWKMLRESSNQHGSAKNRRYVAYTAVVLLGVFMLVGVTDVFLTNRQHVAPQDDYLPAYKVMRWLREYDPSEYYVRHNPNNSWQAATIAADLRFIDVWYHFADILSPEGWVNRRHVSAEPLYIIQTPEEPMPDAPDVALVSRVEGYDVLQLPQSLPMAFTVNDIELQRSSEAGPLLGEDVTALRLDISSPNKIEVVATGRSGLSESLVVMVTHYPGWRVAVDGKEQSLKSVGGYIATDLATGAHKYVFSYSPTSFYVGILISLLSFGGALLLLTGDLGVDWNQVRGKLRAGGARLGTLVPRSLRQAPSGEFETEAVYQDGVLRPVEPLEIEENTNVRLKVEMDAEMEASVGVSLRDWISASDDLIRTIGRAIPLVTALFAIALVVYLSTRLIGLEDFPIYFFTDEAVQTVMAADFVKDGFTNYTGDLFPTYFNKDSTYNLSSITVYVQVIPYLLFGESVFVTRAVSVLISLLGAVAIAFSLRDIYKVSYWWASVLLLSITPAWFLHSRTAFETVMMVSFYAGFLYFYMLYRYKSPKYLYVALVLGALTFYTYSPGQLIIVLTGLLLLISDIRYHWQNRRVAFGGLLLLGLLVLPYLRFYLVDPTAPLDHLTTRAPFWLSPVPLIEKLEYFASEYLYGLSPAYWFFPNETDLARHLMEGYGHIMLVMLPFFLIGLVLAVVNIRSSAYRTILIAMLVAPSGSALVGIGITRILVYVVPAVILITLGLSKVLEWIERLIKWRAESGKGKIAGWMEEKLPSRTFFSLGLLLILVLANFVMLRDALVNGPLWFQDYTLGGMQYGARQLFAEIEDYLEENPNAELLVSPSWTNGADAVARFFLPDLSGIRLGSVEGYLFRHLPLSDNTVFVMIQREYRKVIESSKFEEINVERIIDYPNGEPGFFFVRMQYVENIDEILAAEKEARRELREGEVEIDGESVQVEYSMLDMGQIEHVFDGDRNTVARTLEANPFVIRLIFPETRDLEGISLIMGSLNGEFVVKAYASPDAEPIEYRYDFKGSVAEPEAQFDFDQSVSAQILHLEILDPHSSEPAHIHVWEINLR